MKLTIELPEETIKQIAARPDKNSESCSPAVALRRAVRQAYLSVGEERMVGLDERTARKIAEIVRRLSVALLAVPQGTVFFWEIGQLQNIVEDTDVVTWVHSIREQELWT
jgi:hypothetical protein